MQTTVVQPGTATPVITTSTDDNHHSGYGGPSFRETRLDADFRSLSSEIERFGSAGALASGHTDRLVQTGLSGVHDRVCDSTGKIVGALNTGFTADALAAGKVADAMNAGFAAANTQVAAIGSAAQVLATTFAGQARDDATRNASAISVQATMFANAASVQAEKNAAAAELQAVKDASADQLSQERHHNAVMLKLCECCHETQQGFQAAQAQADRNACDIKQLITADGNATRALINDNERQRLRDDRDALQARFNRIPVGVAVTIPPGL